MFPIATATRGLLMIAATSFSSSRRVVRVCDTVDQARAFASCALMNSPVTSISNAGLRKHFVKGYAGVERKGRRLLAYGEPGGARGDSEIALATNDSLRQSRFPARTRSRAPATAG